MFYYLLLDGIPVGRFLTEQEAFRGAFAEISFGTDPLRLSVSRGD